MTMQSAFLGNKKAAQTGCVKSLRIVRPMKRPMQVGRFVWMKEKKCGQARSACRIQALPFMLSTRLKL